MQSKEKIFIVSLLVAVIVSAIVIVSTLERSKNNDQPITDEFNPKYVYEVNENTIDVSDNFYLEVAVRFDFEEKRYNNSVSMYPKSDQTLKEVKGYFKYNEYEQKIKYIEHVEYCASWAGHNL